MLASDNVPKIYIDTFVAGLQTQDWIPHNADYLQQDAWLQRKDVKGIKCRDAVTTQSACGTQEFTGRATLSQIPH